MKYGEILDFRTKDKAVVGKRYIFSDNLFYISNSPEDFYVSILKKVREDKSLPFLSDHSESYQFIREIIKEEPKYRPYRNTAELKADFFKDCPEIGKRHRPAIWIVSEEGTELEVTGFSYDGSDVFTSDACAYTMEHLFKFFTYLDGSPCGIKEK